MHYTNVHGFNNKKVYVDLIQDENLLRCIVFITFKKLKTNDKKLLKENQSYKLLQ